MKRRQIMTAIGGVGLLALAATGVRGAAVGPKESVSMVPTNQDLYRERAVVPGHTLDSIGIDEGMQCRVEPWDISNPWPGGENTTSILTVEKRASAGSLMRMSDEGLLRIGVDPPRGDFVDLIGYGPHPDIDSVEEADEKDEFIETLVDTGDDQLLAAAPHGGWIERYTDEQAAMLREKTGAVEWACHGFNEGGGAYDRWHVTSTDISPKSFPKLDSIGERKFGNCVSFHGVNYDVNLIGGAAPMSEKEAVRDAIVDRTGGDYPVEVASEDDPYAGYSASNYTNWITERGGGIQIEQNWGLREDEREAVVNAVVDALGY